MVKNVLQGELSPVILQYDTPGKQAAQTYIKNVLPVELSPVFVTIH